MKKNLLGIFLIITVVFVACAAQKKTSSNTDLTYLRMYRSSCFGTCPSYSVEVYDNGLVRYTGRLFVPDSGVYEKNIGAAKAQQLFSKFKEYRIDTLASNYDMQVADLPGVNYTFNYGGKTKEVSNAHFGPAFLRTLAKEVDMDILNRTGHDAPQLDKTWKLTSSVAK